MSCFTKEIVQVVAETVGIGELSDDVAAALTSDLEYRVREVLQEALKFRNHSRRRQLLADDINAALRLLNVEPLYGFAAADAEHALRHVPGADPLFFLADHELELARFVNRELPRCPLETALTTHWLAIEGVQPAVPQNPSASAMDAVIQQKRRKAGAGPRETGGPQFQVRPRLEHHLSAELHMFFVRVTQAIKGTDPGVRAAALRAISLDAGLQQLVPYLSQFVSDEVTHHLRDLPMLRALMAVVYSMLQSAHLDVEPYLHQLMPAVLTCVVGRYLCASADGDENHWELRDFAASLVAVMMRKYGRIYPDLQPRVAKTLCQAFLDPRKPLPTHYGAIVGLCALGKAVVTELVLPHAAGFFTLLEQPLEDERPARRREAVMCYFALRKAVGIVVAADAVKDASSALASERARAAAQSAAALAHPARAGAAASGSADDGQMAADGSDIPYDDLRDYFGAEVVPFLRGADLQTFL